ncbi:PIN domain-like protein, partial [Aureobasidium melanogenum]
MGIKGLLPMLKSIQTHCTLKKFAGQTIGVDAYGWLHRGVVGCAFALALDKPTTIHIDFVLSRVRMLLDFGVTPYLVFDGDNIPSKAGTNASRRKKRQEAKALGLELHKAGKTSQAHQELQKAVDVTPHMARQLIEELKKLNVQFVVAPYEADAQLVYLEQKGIIDGILSEDSDLLVFGAKRLLTKLNQYGELVEVERANFALCKEISLAGWTDSMFMRMAILSGCDYLPNIGKMGLKTAHSYVRKYKDVEKILRMVQLEGKMVVPDKYMERFQQAELTFLHHRVFCPIAQKMVHLNDLPPGLLESNMPYLGPYVDPDTSVGVAEGGPPASP